MEKKVLFFKEKGATLPKIESRWDSGIFVGVRRGSNELIVSDLDGLHVVRSVRNFPFERRCGRDSLSWVVWAPWHR